MSTSGYTSLPDDLPSPEDDGLAAHLPGLELPIIKLPATDGRHIDLSGLAGLTVVYAYPRTGVPGQPLPEGWDAIPGARGCTPQSCAFRDHIDELTAAIRLPTFEVEGAKLLKRITLIIEEGAISHVFYPVFPPDRNAADVLAHLRRRRED